jgi:hypothetical protein
MDINNCPHYDYGKSADKALGAYCTEKKKCVEPEDCERCEEHKEDKMGIVQKFPTGEVIEQREKTIIERAIEYMNSNSGLILHTDTGWLEETEERNIIEGLIGYIASNYSGGTNNERMD